MGNWGDDIDEELQQDKEIKFGFLFSFKSMSHIIQRIDEETGEWDEKHPKDKLFRLWINVMIIFQVLFLVTFGGLALAAVVFYFFYIYVIIQLFNCWRRFKYSALQFWLMTIGAGVVEFIISRLVQDLIFKV